MLKEQFSLVSTIFPLSFLFCFFFVLNRISGPWNPGKEDVKIAFFGASLSRRLLFSLGSALRACLLAGAPISGPLQPHRIGRPAPSPSTTPGTGGTSTTKTPSAKYSREGLRASSRLRPTHLTHLAEPTLRPSSPPPPAPAGAPAPWTPGSKPALTTSRNKGGKVKNVPRPQSPEQGSLAQPLQQLSARWGPARERGFARPARHGRDGPRGAEPGVGRAVSPGAGAAAPRPGPSPSASFGNGAPLLSPTFPGDRAAPARAHPGPARCWGSGAARLPRRRLQRPERWDSDAAGPFLQQTRPGGGGEAWLPRQDLCHGRVALTHPFTHPALGHFMSTYSAPGSFRDRQVQTRGWKAQALRSGSGGSFELHLPGGCKTLSQPDHHQLWPASGCQVALLPRRNANACRNLGRRAPVRGLMEPALSPLILPT